MLGRGRVPSIFCADKRKREDKEDHEAGLNSERRIEDEQKSTHDRADHAHLAMEDVSSPLPGHFPGRKENLYKEVNVQSHSDQACFKNEKRRGEPHVVKSVIGFIKGRSQEFKAGIVAIAQAKAKELMMHRGQKALERNGDCRQAVHVVSGGISLFTCKRIPYSADRKPVRKNRENNFNDADADQNARNRADGNPELFVGGFGKTHGQSNNDDKFNIERL